MVNSELGKYPSNLNSCHNNIIPFQNKKTSSSSLNSNSVFSNILNMDFNSPILEIGGISLFLDDIFLILIIFLLFQEGVTDISLYIVLILLIIL